MSHILCTDRARRYRIALFAGCALTAGALALSSAPVMAGCNSGSVANSALLQTEGCQANASGASSTAVSKFATAGNNAVAVGVSSIAGANATAVGTSAEAGGFGLAIGYDAKAVGFSSMAVGYRAGGEAAVTGNGGNSAFGTETGRSVTGTFNTAIGFQAGSGANGTSNAALGVSAGRNTNGSNNAAMGNAAGTAVTGDSNVAGGAFSGGTVKGSGNIAYGASAGRQVTGNSNVAIGQNAGLGISASSTVAIGLNTRATANRAVALGSGSLADVANTVSVGTPGQRRRIVNVAPAVAPTDAVNLAQVKALAKASPQNAAGVTSLIDDTRLELEDLRALVNRQQERIAQLERRDNAAAALPD